MNIKKIDNQTSFRGLVIEKSALKASRRGVEALEKVIPHIQIIANDIDVKIRRPLFKPYNCDIHPDFLIKVTQKQPAPKNALGKFVNLITKPFLLSEQGFAGNNFGLFSDPLQVVINASSQVLRKIKS